MKNAACSAFSAMPMPAPWRCWACTPCSIAARKRRASSPIDNGQFIAERHAGLVGDVFGRNSHAAAQSEGPLRHRPRTAIPPPAAPTPRNIQPIFADLAGGGLAIAHNGNLTNAHTLRAGTGGAGRDLPVAPPTPKPSSIWRRAAPSARIVDKLIDALRQVEGAYSLVALTSKKLIGVRDPYGVRPLVLGKLDGALILASETCALDIIGAEFVRDIEPGEMVVVDQGRHRTAISPSSRSSTASASSNTSISRGPIPPWKAAMSMRRASASARCWPQEAPADADMVIPVPDSGVPAALGFANAAKIPFELGIIRNHYVGRTFIEPSDRIRHLGVRLKHNPNRAMLKGKRVVLVDDSIVRGTTSKKIVEMVRDAGAAEVHFRVAVAAHHPFLLLWRGHAQHRRPAGAQDGCGGRCAASSAPTAWPSSP